MPSSRKRKHRSCSCRNNNGANEDDEFDIGTLIYNISDTAKSFAKAYQLSASQRRVSARLSRGNSHSNDAMRDETTIQNSVSKGKYQHVDKAASGGDATKDSASRIEYHYSTPPAKKSEMSQFSKPPSYSSSSSCEKVDSDKVGDIRANASSLKGGKDPLGGEQTNLEASIDTTNKCDNANLVTPPRKNEPGQAEAGTGKLRNNGEGANLKNDSGNPMPSSSTWRKHFGELHSFFIENGHCNVPESNRTLGIWIERIRSKFDSRELAEGKIRKLKKLGFDFRKQCVLEKGDDNDSAQPEIDCRKNEAEQKNLGDKLTLMGPTDQQKGRYSSECLSFEMPQLPEGVSDKVFSVPDIGNGWTVQLIARDSSNSSSSSGRVDRIFFAPDGRRFRSIVGVERFLRSSMRGRNISLSQPVPHPKRPSEIWKKSLSKSAVKSIDAPTKEFPAEKNNLQSRSKPNMSELENSAKTLTAATTAKLSAQSIKKLRKQHPKFQDYYQQLLDFRSAYGHSVVPQIYPSNKKLGRWVMFMRNKFARQQKGESEPSLTEDHIQLLNEAGFVWRAKGLRFQRHVSVKIRVGNKQWHKTLTASQLIHHVFPRISVPSEAPKSPTPSKNSVEKETTIPAIESDEDRICGWYYDTVSNSYVNHTYKVGDLVLVDNPAVDQEKRAKSASLEGPFEILETDGDENVVIARGAARQSLPVERLRPFTEYSPLPTPEGAMNDATTSMKVGAMMAKTENGGSKPKKETSSGSKHTKNESSTPIKLSPRELREQIWNQIFQEFKTAHEKRGDGNFFSSKVGPKLHRWAKFQREQYLRLGRERFPKDRLEKLDKLGFFKEEANAREPSVEKKGETSGSNASYLFQTKSSSGTLIESSSGTAALTVNSVVSKPRQEHLDSLWESNFLKLKEIHEKYGDVNQFCGKGGRPLHRWVVYQREKFRKLGNNFETKRMKKLLEIGFDFNYSPSSVLNIPKEEAWLKKYKALLAFKSEHGHCNYSGLHGDKVLANWVRWQRYQKKLLDRGEASALTEKRIKLLDEIEFDWYYNTRWP